MSGCALKILTVVSSSKKRKESMKKLLIAIVLAGVLSLSLVTAVRALLQDTEKANGKLWGATLNLQVGDNDPSTVNFIFNNMQPGEERELTVPIASVGGLSGNFWLEMLIENSSEGDNPESETDITGEGELDDCVEVKVYFENTDNPDLTAVSLDWTPVNDVGEVEKFWGNNVDAWIGVGIAKFYLLARADNCGSESMGDSFDLDLIFHLDQVEV
jgi:hypothetical protein